MEATPPKFLPRIYITGETGGTGSSTVADILAETLHLPHISGGRYYRGIAHDYDIFKREHESMDESQTYLLFWNIYRNLLEENGIEGVDSRTKKYWELPNDEAVLTQFSTAVKTNAEQDGTLDGTYDYYVNEKVLSAALQQPGAVVVQKLTQKIDELKPVITQYNNLAVPFLSVVLTASPNVAAARISQREKRMVTPEEILARRDRDWARYSELYHANGKPVKLHHLHQFADEVINTDNLSAQEVAEQIIRYYLLKIRIIGKVAGEEQHWLARDIIANLAHGLEQFKTHANLENGPQLAVSVRK